MTKNPYKGKFIVFEGPDGSGHTTQAELLRTNLESRGYSVLVTKEPTTESPVSDMIHRVLKKQEILDPGELQVLFTEDRHDHLERLIIPALEAGTIVIGDRYFFSTFAYGSLECDLEWLIKLNDGFLLPDASFLVLASAETCLERIGRRQEGFQLFEEVRNLRRVVEAYRSLPPRFENVSIVDGEQPIAAVHAEVLAKLKKVLQ